VRIDELKKEGPAAVPAVCDPDSGRAGNRGEASRRHRLGEPADRELCLADG
jgi:hypothetical protein